MKKTNIKSTKIIVFIGTVLVWLPILFTLLTAVIGSLASGRLRMDYLMPAELFPLVLAGTLLLFWASRRSGYYKGWIGWSFVIMLCTLFGSQGIAVLTGLASGAHEAAGWRLLLVMSLLILYIAAVIAECILGILLLRRLKKA